MASAAYPAPPAEVVQWIADGRPRVWLRHVVKHIVSHYDVLFKLHVLADKLEDFPSANDILAAIERFDEQVRMLLPLPLITWVYRYAQENSRLRTFLQDVPTREADIDWFEGVAEDKRSYQTLLRIAEDYLRFSCHQSDPMRHSFPRTITHAVAPSTLRPDVMPSTPTIAASGTARYLHPKQPAREEDTETMDWPRKERTARTE